MTLYCISGTPGCGKTTLSAELRRRGYEVVDGNEHMRRHGILGDRDPARDTYEVDLDALSDSLEPYRRSEKVVFFDSHLGHRCDCHGVVVLRCDPEVLAERLRRRGYSEAKVLENVQAECLDVILCEATDSDIPVWEIDCTSRPVEDVADAVVRMVKGEESDCRPGSVDWSREMDIWF